MAYFSHLGPKNAQRCSKNIFDQKVFQIFSGRSREASKNAIKKFRAPSRMIGKIIKFIPVSLYQNTFHRVHS